MEIDPIDLYFKKFGPKQKAMAASVQSLSYCEKMITSTESTTILDAGSSVSSIFFHSRFNSVVTVDDSLEWSDVTKEFLLKTINKEISISPIYSIENMKFDFVFYDYGDMETRIYHFKRILERFNIAIYVDDMHVPFYSDYIQTRCRQYNLRIIPKIPETLDEFGRFGGIITK